MGEAHEIRIPSHSSWKADLENGEAYDKTKGCREDEQILIHYCCMLNRSPIVRVGRERVKLYDWDSGDCLGLSDDPAIGTITAFFGSRDASRSPVPATCSFACFAVLLQPLVTVNLDLV